MTKQLQPKHRTLFYENCSFKHHIQFRPKSLAQFHLQNSLFEIFIFLRQTAYYKTPLVCNFTESYLRCSCKIFVKYHNHMQIICLRLENYKQYFCGNVIDANNTTSQWISDNVECRLTWNRMFTNYTSGQLFSLLRTKTTYKHKQQKIHFFDI